MIAVGLEARKDKYEGGDGGGDEGGDEGGDQGE
jgi:hypothetical protein